MREKRLRLFICTTQRFKRRSYTPIHSVGLWLQQQWSQRKARHAIRALFLRRQKCRASGRGGGGGGGVEERVFRVGRGLIYSQCNFQYFSDQDRCGYINLGSVHCCPGVSRGRDPQLLGVPRLFQAAKQIRAAGMIDSPKGKKATCITHTRVHRRRSARVRVRTCTRARTITRTRVRTYADVWFRAKVHRPPTCPLGLPLKDFNCRPLAFF